jgi:hypothetical protein
VRLRNKWVLAWCVLHAAGTCGPAAGRVILSPERILHVSTTGRRLDQLIPLPDGRWAAREAYITDLPHQVVEILDRNGAHVATLGGFGDGPGKFYWAIDMATVPGEIWIADFHSRILKFSSSGQFIGSILLQKPGVVPFGLRTDPQGGVFWVNTCRLPDPQVQSPCSLLEEYRLDTAEHVKSAVEVSWDEVTRLPLNEYRIDVSPTGQVFLVKPALYRLVEYDPAKGSTREYPVVSRQAVPPPVVRSEEGAEAVKNAAEAAYLASDVWALEDCEVVAIGIPHEQGQLLEVFDRNGRQAGVDLRTNGRVVGKWGRETILAASPEGTGFRITLLKVLFPPSGRAR